jgi:hypothetical protein
MAVSIGKHTPDPIGAKVLNGTIAPSGNSVNVDLAENRKLFHEGMSFDTSLLET